MVGRAFTDGRANRGTPPQPRPNGSTRLVVMVAMAEAGLPLEAGNNLEQVCR